MIHDLVTQLRARSALLQHEARLEGDEPFTAELLDAAADEIERLAPKPWKVWSGGGRVSLQREDGAIIFGPLPGSIFSDGDVNAALLLRIANAHNGTE